MPSVLGQTGSVEVIEGPSGIDRRDTGIGKTTAAAAAAAAASAAATMSPGAERGNMRSTTSPAASAAAAVSPGERGNMRSTTSPATPARRSSGLLNPFRRGGHRRSRSCATTEETMKMIHAQESDIAAQGRTTPLALEETSPNSGKLKAVRRMFHRSSGDATSPVSRDHSRSPGGHSEKTEGRSPSVTSSVFDGGTSPSARPTAAPRAGPRLASDAGPAETGAAAGSSAFRSEAKPTQVPSAPSPLHVTSSLDTGQQSRRHSF